MTEPDRSEGSPRWGEPREQDKVHERALASGIGISAVLHIIAIVLYAVVMSEWSPQPAVLGMDSPSRPSNEMRVVRLVEIEPPELSVEPPPEELPEAAEIEVELVVLGPPELGPVELTEPPGRRRAAEVLQVRSSDTRLWREALPEAFALTDAEYLQLELAGRLEEWTDSVARAVEAEYALTDWTRTDDQGRRWGISPGQLHLGDITLPLPFYFSGNSIQRANAARRAWEDQTILNGAADLALRESWRERGEAILRRRNREREEEVEAPPAASAATADTIGGSGG